MALGRRRMQSFLIEMPLSMDVDGLDVLVSAVPLTSDAFAPFGELVENPRPDLHPSQHPAVADPGGAKAQAPLPFDAVSANQGSAIKYQHVTRMVNLYGQAPSKAPGEAVMNMFTCAARKLQRQRQGSEPASGSEGYFNVRILERHPYTTQTFSPLAKDPNARYLSPRLASLMGDHRFSRDVGSQICVD
ncbi:putative ureidoglycolate hydrolase protein [Phaeoacremonium minimum UCRPA7]|uniref:Putative ureidoglycolate hydrolase protein n=1 Tax=Phaeoacremonium minimum (strain UCR-PA7) TaxID=1286976 RepID=R8BVS9_PHAM7|nr:putative ureidoglycolate hydrolase protein [Phaeoacremonium minimum UCRPA7]EOO03463.1 putative ureidoglycolate hydrolase protein [Phaeoacremonium minimum UCRPA7]